MNDEWAVIYKGRILGGLQFTGVHERVQEWVNTVSGAYFDKLNGVSYINGSTYYNVVIVPTEEDLLAFKLTFAGSVV